jgi:hypothetical protein
MLRWGFTTTNYMAKFSIPIPENGDVTNMKSICALAAYKLLEMILLVPRRLQWVKGLSAGGKWDEIVG